MIDKSTRDAIAAKLDKLEMSRQKMDPSRYRNGGGYTPEEIATLYREADLAGLTTDEVNAMRGKVEQYDFLHDNPDRYFVYINEGKQHATVWTGDMLGHVTFHRQWQDNFGGTRVSLRMTSLSGCEYYGTYYKSAGDYARIRKCKA